MGATFNTYNIATTGLYASQAALTTVSTNLSNVNTDGYSRQRVTTTEQRILASSGTSYASGVDVESVSRLRNSFLDNTYRQANASAEYWEAKNTALEDAQALLSEYESSDSSTDGEYGVQALVEAFFNSWETLTTDPSSQSARSTVVENAVALVETLTEINEQLTELQTDAAARLADGVDTLNGLAEQVAALNLTIMQANNNGSSANDLSDQRDALLDQMSALANISVSALSNGMVNVTLSGVALVQGLSTHELTVTQTNGQTTVEWEGLGSAASITGGSLQAYLEEADATGVTALSGTGSDSFSTAGSSYLATLRQGLNDILTTVAVQVNTLLTGGTDANGDAGAALFVKVDDAQGFILGNIQVNPAIASDVDKLAVGTGGESEDSSVAAAIIDLQESELFTCDELAMNLMDFYQTLISWVATTGDTVGANCDTQSTLLAQAETSRQSVSSVSQDEELTKMITYQNAYNASARVLSTIDGLIGDLIEDLGS